VFWETDRVNAVTGFHLWSHTYDRNLGDVFGRNDEGEAELVKLKADMGNEGAYQYATIYAQWGARAKALEWLDTAMRMRDVALLTLKTDPLMDPLRKEPRFQATERELKFPN
jgi:hypothetical protein